jgi:hypothetical protein
VIHDITIIGTVVLVDLKARVMYNHVVDIRVEEAEVLKLKKFVHSCSKIPSEESGEVKWNDTPIRPPGNIVHCVNKKEIQLPFTEVWDARRATDPLTVNPNERMNLEWMDIKRDARVLVEVIPEIYQMDNKYGITLHLLTVGLLSATEIQASEELGTKLLIRSPKKKRRVK